MAGYYRALDTTLWKVNGWVRTEACGGSCNHSTRYATVIAEWGSHLGEQTLASGGYRKTRLSGSCLIEMTETFGGLFPIPIKSKETLKDQTIKPVHAEFS